MFGYIAINKPEMKFREFDVYQSYYCGFCHALKENYGKGGQLTLSYDLTFLILLLTSLYDTDETKAVGRCVAHPLHKHHYTSNKYSEYAADMNVLLSYHKCMDDWLDEHNYKKRIAGSYLGRKAKHIKQKYPEKWDTVEKMLTKIHEIEQKNSSDMDEASGCFGEIMAELFAIYPDAWEKELRRIGFYLGKFIYLMDAYEDMEKDQKTGNYNPLLHYNQSEDFEEECEHILTMMMAQCSRAFEKLPVVDNVEILRNILYSGVWCRYEVVKAKRKEAQDV